MSFKPKLSRSKKKKFKLDFSDKTTRLALTVVVVLAIALPLSIGLGLFSIYINRPAAGSELGYMSFQIYDTQNKELMNGSVAVTNWETGALVDTVNVGDTFTAEVSVIATIYDIDSGDLAGREFLPMTIVPLTSSDPSDPQVNTILAYFYMPVENISVSIVELNGTYGNFSESDMYPDMSNNITVQFDVDVGGNNDTAYGASSYVPDILLPNRSATEGINGFGLWLCINGTELATSSVYVNGIEGIFYYLEEEDASVIHLDAMWPCGELVNQTITFETKTFATAIGVFEGFIDDIGDTYVQIIGS